MLQYIKTLLSGFAIGIANVIPGVSGGTFALILGIYDEFIGAFDGILRWILAFIKFIFGFKKENWEKFKQVSKEVNWSWIIILFVGMLLAIVLTSGLVTWLLTRYPAQTYGAFFGFILASVVVPWSKMEKKALPEFLAIIIGFVLLFLLTGYEPNIDYLEVSGVTHTDHPDEGFNLIEWDAYDSDNGVNYAYYVFRSVKDSNNLEDYIKIGITKNLSYEDDELNSRTEYRYTVRAVVSDPAFWFVIVASAISAAAMILPGLSGSFLLLLMGVYSYIVGSFSTLFSDPMGSIPPLFIYAIGMAMGLLLFARVLKHLLNKYHSVTMGFLIGLMLGSLRLIYPFLDKLNAVSGAEADEIPKLLFWDMPSNVSLSKYLRSGEFLTIIACFVIGFAMVLIMHFSTNKRNKTNTEVS